MFRNGCLVFVLTIGFSSVLIPYWIDKLPSEIPSSSESCITHIVTRQRLCRPNCLHKSGFFSLPGMRECHPYLTCKDFSDIKLEKLIGHGIVKEVFIAHWKNHKVAVNNLRNNLFQDDFDTNIERHATLGPSPYISQYIGKCNNSFITEYHSFGNANNFNKVLKPTAQLDYRARFSLCLDYVQILSYLHNHRMGTFVTCDSNSVYKIGTQYLLTDDFRLVLNDLDSVALCDKSGIVCGRRELQGDLIAPEQVWPFQGWVFDADSMPPYNEKIDVWRIPDVCEYFLGDFADVLRFSVIGVHKKCKLSNPNLRPSAREILEEYLKIFYDV